MQPSPQPERPATSPLRPCLDHAVVLGGSVAGLLAARVLSDHARRVTVFDRDRPAGDAPRRGVPQGHHIHILLRAGLLALDELFPGLLDDMRRDPAVPKIDLAGDLAWRHLGHWKVRFGSEYESFPQTRPALEARLRRRVEALPNVTFHWQTEVEGLVFDAAGETVRGVEIRPASGGGSSSGAARSVAADLVVDATGRGSRLPGWLSQAGFAAPREEVQEIGLTYTTAVFRRRAHGEDWQALYVSPRHPAGPEGARAGAMFPIGDDLWVTTLMGYGGEAAPTDLPGFLTYARSLAAPHVTEALESAEPAGEIHRIRIPRQVRRRYEGLRRLPGGLLPLGDALCAFDPVFGQGMTAAALEARELARLLARRRLRSGAAKRLPRAFLRRAARILDRPWSVVTGEAFRLPHLASRRPLPARLLHRYGERLAAVAAHDTAVAASFYRVMHLLDAPLALLHPRLVWRVLRGGGPVGRATEVRTGPPTRRTRAPGRDPATRAA